MRDHRMFVALVAKPIPFENGTYISDRLIEAFNNIFMPYVRDSDREISLDRLRTDRYGMQTWPMLHLLALIKHNGMQYRPEMVIELAAALPDFLRKQWPGGNKLLREEVAIVDSLHKAGLSDISPIQFTSLAADAMSTHSMGAQAAREMFFPMEFGDGALEDPAVALIGQALIEDQELQKNLLSTKLMDNRFIPALKHYPREALTIAMDRPGRWDQALTKDLGL